MKHFSPSTILCVLAVFLSGLVLPFMLLPIIRLTGHSEIVEEVVKALVVCIVVYRFENARTKILAGLFFGFLFGFSETMLYLSSFVTDGTVHLFFERFLFTVPMHMLTATILAVSIIKKRWMIILGVLVTILVHLTFNSIVIQLVS